jgi:hypothetical protein
MQFRPILDAVKLLLRQCNFFIHSTPASAVQNERNLNDTHDSIVTLVKRQKAIGIPPCSPSYQGGAVAWEFDVNQAFDDLLKTEKELFDSVKAFPPSPTRKSMVPDWNASAGFAVAIHDYNDLVRRLQARTTRLVTLQNQIQPPARPTPIKPAKIAVAIPAKPPVDTTPALSERQYLILEAMLRIKASDPARRKKTEAIAVAAEGKSVDPASFKRPISNLKKRGLVGTLGGPDGGCWLTEQGRTLAEQLKNR